MTDPSKTDPTKTDPAKTDPAKTDPAKTDPVKVDPTKTDPFKVNPTRRPEPPPKVKLPGMVLNPFARENLGIWFRVKTDKAGKESYQDLVLKAKDASSYTMTTGSGDVKTDISPYWVKGEEAVTVEGRKWLCEVREWETPPVKRWILVEGKNPGAVLKEESANSKFATKRLWEHSVRIGRRTLDILVVEGTVNGASVKTWFCADVPLGVIKRESPEGTTLLVDFGDEDVKRPPLPQ